MHTGLRRALLRLSCRRAAWAAEKPSARTSSFVTGQDSEPRLATGESGRNFASNSENFTVSWVRPMTLASEDGALSWWRKCVRCAQYRAGLSLDGS